LGAFFSTAYNSLGLEDLSRNEPWIGIAAGRLAFALQFLKEVAGGEQYKNDDN